MENLNDIREVWLSANLSGLPKADKALRAIKKYQRKQIFKSLASVLLALAMTAVMIWVVFVYQSAMLSTRIGEACFFITLLIVIVFNAASLRRMPKVDSNRDFITYLKQEQQRQINFSKRTQVAGFIMASAGLLLYIFEQVKGQIPLMLLSYALAAAWIALCWFVVRPRAMKRRLERIEECIARLEGLSDQITTK